MSLPRPIEKLNMLMQCLPDAPFKNRLAEEIVAYGQACRAAALEEAAEICRNEEWRNDGNEVAYIKAFNDGCKDCEAAIRRLK